MAQTSDLGGVRLNVGRVIVTLLLLCAGQALADEIIVGTPGMVASAAIGNGIAGALNSLAMARQASIERQAPIANLQSRLAACGHCAERDQLQHDLQAETSAEENRLWQLDQMYSGAPKMDRLFLAVADPLGILPAAIKRMRQHNETIRDHQNLVAQYCYATTDTQAAEQSCTLDIHEADFVNSDRLVLSKCGEDSPSQDCVKTYSLVASLQAATAGRCGFDLKTFARPATEVFTLCHHPTRPHPDQVVAPTISETQILDGGSMDGLRHYVSYKESQNLFNYDRIFLNWTTTHRYQTIHCYYRFAGETTSRAEAFWYISAPPGVSELRTLAQQRLGSADGLGLLNLGGAAVAICPPTYEEAQALKQTILATAVPTNSGDIVPNVDIVYKASIVVNFMTRLSLSPELQGPLKAVQQTNAPLIHCTYAPFKVTSAADYWYWSQTVPDAWPQLRNLIFKGYAAHPDWPPPVIPLGTIVLHSCPATLADAEAITRTLGQPEPAIIR